MDPNPSTFTVAAYTRGSPGQAAKKLQSLAFYARELWGPEVTIVEFSDAPSTKRGAQHPERERMTAAAIAGRFDAVLVNTMRDATAAEPRNPRIVERLHVALARGAISALNIDMHTYSRASAADVVAELFPHGDPDAVVEAWHLLREAAAVPEATATAIIELDRALVLEYNLELADFLEAQARSAMSQRGAPLAE